MMRDDITIVIPTYRRHALLAACLDHYAAYQGPIIVADGSPEPYARALPRNVSYLHAPEAGILERMQKAVGLAGTPYLVMRGDRRFTSLAGILRCADFLDDHPDYVLAQGLWFWAEPPENRKRRLKLLGENLLAWLDVWQKRLRGSSVPLGLARLARLRPDFLLTPAYCENALRPVAAGSPLERVRASFSPYQPTFYAVTRTSAWKEAVKPPFTTLSNLNLQELYTHVAMMLLGKAATLPVLYACVFPSVKKDKDLTAYAGVTEQAKAQEADEEVFIEGVAALFDRRIGDRGLSGSEAAVACMEAYKGFFGWQRGGAPRLAPHFPVRGHLEAMDEESFDELQKNLVLGRRLLKENVLA